MSEISQSPYAQAGETPTHLEAVESNDTRVRVYEGEGINAYVEGTIESIMAVGSRPGSRYHAYHRIKLDNGQIVSKRGACPCFIIGAINS